MRRRDVASLLLLLCLRNSTAETEVKSQKLRAEAGVHVEVEHLQRVMSRDDLTAEQKVTSIQALMNEATAAPTKRLAAAAAASPPTTLNEGDWVVRVGRGASVWRVDNVNDDGSCDIASVDGEEEVDGVAAAALRLSAKPAPVHHSRAAVKAAPAKKHDMSVYHEVDWRSYLADIVRNGSRGCSCNACLEHRHLQGDPHKYPHGQGPCHELTNLADWPTHDTLVNSSTPRKSILDVHRALAGRRLVIIGSSISTHFQAATHCALDRFGLTNASEQYSHWGWGNLIGSSLEGLPSRKEACRSRVAGLFRQWASQPETYDHAALADCREMKTWQRQVLDKYDIVVVAYHPDHYCNGVCGGKGPGSEIAPRFWGDDLRLLGEFTRSWAQEKAGRMLIFREPLASHFKGTGSVADPDDPNAAAATSTCECTPAWTQTGPDRRESYVRQTRAAAAAYPEHVRVLPFYEESRKRHDLHVGGSCGQRPRHDFEGNEIPGSAGRKCCDCTHFCYAPEFYDALYFRGLWELLQ